MSNEKTSRNHLVLGENQVFRAGSRLRGEVAGDRTVINLGELAQEYKLSKAYADVCNLEFRSDKEIKIQTFSEYFDLRAEVVPPAFSVERKLRPRFPDDEAYRNTKMPHLYPNGNLLVLVDKAVYDAVAASIDRYVRDVGRDGYWATIHVVQGGTPADVRSYIRRRRPVGVLLVGSIPAPWFELDNDIHGVHSEFP